MLDIIGVRKSYNGRTIVNNVDLNVAPGEFISILGPSGCGKTTLLRLIAGHEFVDSGKLYLDKQNITNLPAHSRDVHTVFQRYALFPHMNIYNNIAFGLRCSHVPESEIKRRVEDMLDLANLKGREKQPVTSLSGGEQQRVALIRALVNLPKLLLLDEPLGALDLKLRLQLQQELIALQKRVKTTFVFVTHDQQEALNMSDRIAVMHEGRIEQIGTPNEIYEKPKTLFVASFIGGINQLSGYASTVSTQESIVEIENVGKIHANVAAEGDVILCVRPEKLSIHKSRPTNKQNVIEGYVKQQTYLGTYTQYDVTIKNGSIVSVFSQNLEKAESRQYQTGDQIYLGWNASLSQVFTKEKAVGHT